MSYHQHTTRTFYLDGVQDFGATPADAVIFSTYDESGSKVVTSGSPNGTGNWLFTRLLSVSGAWRIIADIYFDGVLLDTKDLSIFVEPRPPFSTPS